MSTTVAHYLTDLTALLKQAALEAKAQSTEETGQPGHQFALGRLTAYYEVVSLMKQQAMAFGLDLEKMSLNDFDPDRDLLGTTKQSKS